MPVTLALCEAEAVRLLVRAQPDQLCETLAQNKK